MDALHSSFKLAVGCLCSNLDKKTNGPCYGVYLSIPWFSPRICTVRNFSYKGILFSSLVGHVWPARRTEELKKSWRNTAVLQWRTERNGGGRELERLEVDDSPDLTPCCEISPQSHKRLTAYSNSLVKAAKSEPGLLTQSTRYHGNLCQPGSLLVVERRERERECMCVSVCDTVGLNRG